MPASYELVSQRKGFKRYKSPRLVELLLEYAAVQEQREAALSGVLQVSIPQHNILSLTCTVQSCHDQRFQHLAADYPECGMPDEKVSGGRWLSYHELVVRPA